MTDLEIADAIDSKIHEYYADGRRSELIQVAKYIGLDVDEEDE